MVLEGGVAGAQPLHKGGRLRPTAHKSKVKGEREAPALTLLEDRDAGCGVRFAARERGMVTVSHLGGGR